jgi:hypothetical protein
MNGRFQFNPQTGARVTESAVLVQNFMTKVVPEMETNVKTHPIGSIRQLLTSMRAQNRCKTIPRAHARLSQ